MNHPARATQQGFLLIAVVIVLAVLAAIALLLSGSASSDNALVKYHAEGATLDYLVEAGMEHAEWLLAQGDTCSGYTNLPDTSFGAGNYSAKVTPTNGSPVTVTAVGTLPDGTARDLTRDGIRTYDLAAPVTLVLQPGDSGKDAFIEGESGHTVHNKGNDNELRTGSAMGKEYRSLLQFDLNTLPRTARVNAATLELAVRDVQSSHVVAAHRVLRDWSEADVSWQNYNGKNPWSAPGGDHDATAAASVVADSVGPLSMDITALAEAWVNGAAPNHGLMLRTSPAVGGGTNKYYSSDISNEPRPKMTVTYFCECGTVCTGVVAGNSLIFSTDSPAELRGLSFAEIDLVNYDPVADTATLELAGASTTLAEGINAVHVLENGNIVLSTKNDATLGGLSFEKADLVEYDPVTNTATMYFDGSLHFADANENISSAHILQNGNLVLSTDNDATLGGLTFSDKDLVEYNSATSNATIYFDGDATTLSQAITAVHVLENGHIVIAAKGNTTLGGMSFTSADLVEYDIATDTATLYFPGNSAFSDSNEKIVSVHIAGDSGPAMAASGHYLDEFNAVAYNGDDGSYNWSNDWQEVAESDGPSSGILQILSSTRCTSSNCIRIGHSDTEDQPTKALVREADLGSATTATLSYDYEVQNVDGNGSVLFRISGDGGSSWTTLATYTISSGSGSESFDISTYMAANTQIRVEVTGKYSMYAFIDKVRIDVDGGGGGGGGGGAPGPYTETYDEWTASQSDQWQVKNLSSLGVPANAVVEVAVMNDRSDAQRWGGVRAAGSSLDRRLQLHEAESGGVDVVVMHVQANGNSEIEHYSDNTGDVYFALLGYWNGGTYVERFDNFSASASGSWQDRNLDAYGVAADQVAEIVIANTASSTKRIGGVRANGSGVGNRFIEIHEAESGGVDTSTMLVVADNTSNATIEVYAESSTDIDFYLVGYWSTPPGAFTEANSSDFDPSSPSGTWSDWDLSGAGVPADAVAYIAVMNGDATSESHLGARRKGLAVERRIMLQESENGGYDTASWHALVDANSLIEFYDENAQRNHRFRILGWWVLP